LLYAAGDRENVIRDIESVRKVADYVVVSCHWGIEFVDFPSPNIRRLARQMADAGRTSSWGTTRTFRRGLKNPIIPSFFTPGELSVRLPLEPPFPGIHYREDPNLDGKVNTNFRL
jgi:hypothetical protein